MRRWLALSTLLGTLAIGADATAQPVSPVPKRDVAWQTITGITLGVGAASQLLMPRIFYADPEVTVGWKARWHVSALAPVMTLSMIAVLNEYVGSVELAVDDGFRPSSEMLHNRVVSFRDLVIIDFGRLKMNLHLVGGYRRTGRPDKLRVRIDAGARRRE